MMNQAQIYLDKIYSDAQFANKISPYLFPTSIADFQGLFLKRKIQELKPKVILELGYGYGISALWMESSAYRAKKHIIVDPIRLSCNSQLIYTFLKRQPNVFFNETETSQQFLGQFERKSQKADMIFIDADERFDGFMADMYFSVRSLSPKGVIIVRNAWNPSIRKGLSFFIKNLEIAVDDLSPIDYFIIKNISILNRYIFKKKLGKLGLCVLRVMGIDTRPWNHYRAF